MSYIFWELIITQFSAYLDGCFFVFQRMVFLSMGARVKFVNFRVKREIALLLN